MKILAKNYEKSLKEAKNLPTHINGELQDHYKFYNEKKHFQTIMYSEKVNPVSVFEALHPRYTGATRFYIKSIPTYRKNGSLKKMRDWKKKLMFHKAWVRTDIEVKEVTFDIIGIKRQTTHLPAGVLIDNINFKI